jgi:hypothetical protein
VAGPGHFSEMYHISPSAKGSCQEEYIKPHPLPIAASCVTHPKEGSDRLYLLDSQVFASIRSLGRYLIRSLNLYSAAMLVAN